MHINQESLSSLISTRLNEKLPELQKNYQSSNSQIGFFICDDLLPLEVAKLNWNKFPNTHKLKKNKSLREQKHVGSNVDDFDPLIKSIIYAFQCPSVVKAVETIVCLRDLVPDKSLYAAGVSSMSKGDFLKPHLDNAMNSDRTLWRRFNLLYYVSPLINQDDGGAFELWPSGVGAKRLSIQPKFNRLVLMACHDHSWHSVSMIKSNIVRSCVSTYYFSKTKPSEKSKFHVTTFRDENPSSIRDFLLKIDSKARNYVRKIFKLGFFNKSHIYNDEQKRS